MSTLKCKMCGGALKYEEGKTVIECEYCGSLNTIPNVGDEKRLQLFDRANRLRSNCDFDKAYGVYEAIVAEYPEEAEAYWGLVLCKYGIEYVDDPATGKKVPTCHRSSFDGVFDDPNFEMVMEYCDTSSRDVYRDEAKQIEEIRKGIVEISSKEEPYDIFICYKETDENGDRTIDSVIAQDVYDELTVKNYKVFFSRITLEDKLGREYEPYIFAALNSAKVMLVFGTSYAYFNAVWVKNEWTRFLKLMESNKSKYLIPCYKDIDAYDMPKEFSKLQAQDMGKVGAIQDLVRGIQKIVKKEEPKATASVSGVMSGSDTVSALLKRASIFLEDGNWSEADKYYERVLDQDPENADAYLGKLLTELHVLRKEELVNCEKPFDANNSYQKAIRFGGAALSAELRGYIDSINTRNENVRRQKEEQKRTAKEKKNRIVKRILVVVVPLFVIVSVLILVFSFIIPNSKYNTAMDLYNTGNYAEANAIFSSLGDYKEATHYKYISSLKLCNAGDIVTFGSYHDANEWIVLEVDGTNIHLLSKKAVDCRNFDDGYMNWWKNSEIRHWLNDDFFTHAFTDEERDMIKESDGDKVTLLSIDEARSLLTDDMLTAEATEYAVQHGAHVSSDNHCDWWLRSPGNGSGTAAYVDNNGYVFESGNYVSSVYNGVRPAIWIDLES
ncbi:Tetratricopeptide repeat-containing protein [Ruminococcaceae bacterium YRB3002]|nr:Tetratricopeptide repeat-containing protein [Ruminococcaceae bacterium YRB3002]